MPYAVKKSQNSGKRFKGPGGKSIKVLVNQAMLARSETKYSQNTSNEISVTNGVAPVYFDWPNLIPGTGSNGRIGNNVYLTGLGVRCLYNNNSVAESTYIREVVMEVDGGYFRSNADITTALFEGGTDVTFSMSVDDVLRKIQKDGIKVLSDRTLLISANTVAASDSGNKQSKWSKRMSQKLIHRDNSTSQPINKRYTVMLLARDPHNDVNISTTEASVCTEMYYKDM